MELAVSAVSICCYGRVRQIYGTVTIFVTFGLENIFSANAGRGGRDLKSVAWLLLKVPIVLEFYRWTLRKNLRIVYDIFISHLDKRIESK